MQQVPNDKQTISEILNWYMDAYGIRDYKPGKMIRLFLIQGLDKAVKMLPNVTVKR